MAFADSKQFAVICARLSLQFGSVDGTRGRVKLRALETYPNPIPESSKSVFITTGVEIKIVTIGGNFVEVYTVNDGSSVTDELPRNVNCLNTSEPILTPLHTEPAVLLQCNTTNGMVVYVIPIPIVQGADARGFPADGLVLSSQDGTYVIVVKGPVLTSQENGAPGKQVVLRSQITAVDNLDSDNVRVLTKEKRHIVINLERGSQRVMPGGHPVLSEWVGTSNDYIYLTEDDILVVVNDTSIEPEYGPKGVANKQQMMLFVEQATTQTPIPTPTPDPHPPSPPKYGTNVDAIGWSCGGIVVVGLIASTLIAITVVLMRKENNLAPFQRLFCTQSDDSRAEIHLESSQNMIELPEIRRPEDHDSTQSPDPAISTVSPPVHATPDNLDSDNGPHHHGTPVFPTTHVSNSETHTIFPEHLSSGSEMSELPSVHSPPQQASEGRNQQHTTNTTGAVLVSNTDSTSVDTSAFTYPYQEESLLSHTQQTKLVS